MVIRFLFSFLILMPALAFAQPDQFKKVKECNRLLEKALDPEHKQILALADQLHTQYSLLEDKLGPKFLRIHLGATLAELDQRLANYAEMAFDPTTQIANAREALNNMRLSLNESLNQDQIKLIDTVPLNFSLAPQLQTVQPLPSAQSKYDAYRYSNPYRPQDPSGARP